jgi:hypothetical protein
VGKVQLQAQSVRLLDKTDNGQRCNTSTGGPTLYLDCVAASSFRRLAQIGSCPENTLSPLLGVGDLAAWLISGPLHIYVSHPHSMPLDIAMSTMHDLGKPHGLTVA